MNWQFYGKIVLLRKVSYLILGQVKYSPARKGVQPDSAFETLTKTI